MIGSSYAPLLGKSVCARDMYNTVKIGAVGFYF